MTNDQSLIVKSQQNRIELVTRPAWHQRRHHLAQHFMDRFVRQNIAEIDEIVAEEHIEKTLLTPAGPVTTSILVCWLFFYPGSV